ncbi:BspA family leucine-rich repeat surface protein, partial [Chryseobacterium sp. SIMBA_028]
PKLSQVISTFGMFYGCTALYGNSSFNTWNTSSITNMSHMFASATQFNQPIGNWDTSHVTNMNWMLHYLDYFNQPI